MRASANGAATTALTASAASVLTFIAIPPQLMIQRQKSLLPAMLSPTARAIHE
jgi:hypothetical protein